MSLSENFDEYMRAIGVGMASRQVGNVIKPKFIVSVAEGVISMKTQSTFKSTEIKFKLDEEFEERTADDRVTKVGSNHHQGPLHWAAGTFCTAVVQGPYVFKVALHGCHSFNNVRAASSDLVI
uniref:Lipocalin/cytosolic fatty-acid binding domain-containing protein n=1 Tax=Gadus morhua TaxID=8049 RepID=A0A8C5CAN8_GADMO